MLLKIMIYCLNVAVLFDITYVVGWGSIHLGFSNNTDPEPGRCRRTDGKKWRCSRDAVADQKYCERHLNRGRHRSRKPVEGQTGQSATRTTSMVTTKPTPMSSLALSSVALPSGLANQHLQSLELRSSNSSAGGTHTNRLSFIIIPLLAWSPTWCISFRH